MNILFIPRWYPSRIDPMPGLFVMRQAEALALIHQVTVLSVHPGPACKGKYETDVSVENKVRNIRVYYTLPSGKNGFLSGIRGILRYINAYRKGIGKLPEQRPDIIHAHVLTRDVIIAWFLSVRWKIPFIISEHWSRYFPENGTYSGLIRKAVTRFLVKRSSALITVSRSLKEAMFIHRLGSAKNFIVGNVVDIGMFVPSVSARAPGKPVLLHVSCFEDKSKNISGLLKAVSGLADRGRDFVLYLAGTGPDFVAMKNLCQKLGLGTDRVIFTGLLQDEDLVKLYHKADFLIQSSRYETFGTVVIEALSCGIPVVATNTGVAADVITSSSGILIQQPIVDDLMNGIEKMLLNYSIFEKNKIHSYVSSQFSGHVIAEKLALIYREMLKL